MSVRQNVAATKHPNRNRSRPVTLCSSQSIQATTWVPSLAFAAEESLDFAVAKLIGKPRSRLLGCLNKWRQIWFRDLHSGGLEVADGGQLPAVSVIHGCLACFERTGSKDIANIRRQRSPD